MFSEYNNKISHVTESEECRYFTKQHHPYFGILKLQEEKRANHLSVNRE